MTEDRYLIVNADDFGVSNETNTAIKELYSARKITSVSLLAVANFAREAVQIAKELLMPVGCHWAFNSDYENEPWSPLSDSLSSIVDKSNNLASLSYFARHAKAREVLVECRAQYEFIINNGLRVDHLDSHCGSLYGINGRRFYNIAFDLASEFDLPFRFPKNPAFIKRLIKSRVLYNLIKLPFFVVLKSAEKKGVKLISDMIANSKKATDIGSYIDFQNYYLNMIRDIKPGITEFFLHPSYYSKDKSKEWNKIRTFDLEFLNSEAFNNLIKNEGIKLVSYDITKTINLN
ncbi:MAG: ChbG/HpnK family deacetylase [Christensenellaceae bacterium]|jgi:predicted glycoside hydrolase/deacetylase ChbG (UPF0249 family)|nr:ChbG/HpnK family deacetylase [Christensenellaceae bacterium]